MEQLMKVSEFKKKLSLGLSAFYLLSLLPLAAIASDLVQMATSDDLNAFDAQIGRQGKLVNSAQGVGAGAKGGISGKKGESRGGGVTAQAIRESIQKIVKTETGKLGRPDQPRSEDGTLSKGNSGTAGGGQGSGGGGASSTKSSGSSSGGGTGGGAGQSGRAPDSGSGGVRGGGGSEKNTTKDKGEDERGGGGGKGKGK